MQVLAAQTKDPVRACWSRCIAVHPMHLGQLCSTFIGVLADVAGIERGSRVFAPLWYTVTWQDLARIPWGQLTAQLRARTSLPIGQLEGLVEHVRLFADRAVLHHRLYLAKSGTTLKLLRKCFLPAALPLELINFAVEFHRHLREMDEALRTGRASLDRFGHLALLGEPVPALRAILEQAQACAEAYGSAYNAAYQIAEGVEEYLAWRASRQEENAAMRPDHRGSQRPATRAALSASHPGSDPSVESGSPASKPDAHSTRGGGFTIMSDKPASELLAFCATCPPPREVIAALAEVYFKLTFTMEEQHISASLQTPPVPAQFHFRDAHGTEVIYLAGKDVGEEGECLPSHASRFWLYPGADAAAAHLVAQFCAKKWRLSWQHSARAQKRAAVA